ncbi:hypothetical protein OEZ85_004097 [Tetradesmus obliquus]|uniref:Uncharacterized protein n=1 Tax=Tetradesmus obliquus TaxID=3088 RepID=A0ABY8UDX8_TETOB|nr:hypothetical protein OEZ85_004097 [Tetradesmus obliquus]
MMLANSNIVARRAAVAAPRSATPVLPRRLVVRKFKEGEQADTSQQGSKAPKNPITGERLTPVDDVRKEGYQAGQVAGQSENTKARIMGQLDGQDGRLPFGEMQAFDGLGPEVTNSRLAMLGFAIAAFWELTQGIDVFEQVKRYPLITIATFVTFTVASWIPFLQGQSYNVKSGPFTPALEVTLGRIAMIGFVGLILNEAYFQRPFFPHLF